MVTVLLSLGGLLLAAVAAWWLPVGRRALLPVAVLAVPIALTLPKTVRHETRAIDKNFGLSRVEAEIVPPIHWPAYRNDRLLLGISRLVPADASISFIPGGRWTASRSPSEARRIYVQTGWVRWVAFAIAPRLVVAGSDAPWAVLVDQSPVAAGIRPRRAWRFGRDWLVER